MPPARLLLQMPSASQPLSILRSATTTTAAAFHPNCAGNSTSNGRTKRASSSDSSRDRRSCRNSNRNSRSSNRCRYSSVMATASPAATLLSLSSALQLECETCPRMRHRAAAFGTVSTSQRTSFPRHGKAVAPLLEPLVPPAPLAPQTSGRAETLASAATIEKNKEEEKGEEEKEEEEKEAGQWPQQEAAEEQKSERQLRQLRQTERGSEGGKAEEARTESGTEISKEQKREESAEDEWSDGGGSSDAGSVVEEMAAAPAGPADVIELGPPTTPSGPIETIFGSGIAQTSEQERDQEREQQQPLSQRQPPHLTPPPYVHHFDSYSLVRQLASSGYTQAQAITAMKAVRVLLGRHLEVAQSGLVSKSDVENEAYLFKAACAELGIEVRNNRRRADEQMRQQRALLQHEVDIAGQSVSQELLTLNDVVRGLFDDRKMAVREEQKAAESQIQKLNYKITIMLNSEMRSEIEGVRWVLIRRSVLGIIFMVIVSLGSLRYASYRSHEKEKQLKLEAEQAARAADTAAAALPEAAEFLTAN